MLNNLIFFQKKFNNVNMKRILTVIFGILFVLCFNLPSSLAILPPSPTNPNAKPILIKTQGLKVYIPQKDMLSTTMKHAFMDWQKHTNGNFSFEFVGTKSTANIVVVFVESGMNTICKRQEALGCTKFHSARTVYGNQRILVAKIYISMYDQDGKSMTSNQIYTIMLHEIGHALGLKHSEDQNSLMYESTNSQMADKQEIQPEDSETLYELYGIKQN